MSDRLAAVQERLFDFADRRTWQPAMEGITRVILMRPPYTSNVKRNMYPFLEYLAGRPSTRWRFFRCREASAGPGFRTARSRERCCLLDCLAPS